ncbi:MAG: D-arabinono-1,4-lactone oxidase [Myxococcota bacterium]|nr:D-arabinono-1,4-lactone oxidase [Myxococcota bacterium]
MTEPETEPRADPGAERWDNWAGNLGCDAARIERPASEPEVQEAVRSAARGGLPVRVAGSGHSFQPLVATEGMLLSLDGLSGVLSADPDSGLARVAAGTKLHAIGEPLHEAGLAMQNLGDVDVQALAGALSTGTHGTGRTLRNLPSQIEALRIVGADGEVRVFDASDPDALDAARISLGAFGVITEVTLRCVPSYRLHETTRRLSPDEAMAEADAVSRANRHWEFWWYPGRDFCEVKTLALTDAEPESVAEERWQRIDWSHRILPSVRELRFVEMEYSVPAEAGPDCFVAVRSRMQERHPEVQWPVEYRMLAADSAWLSTAHERDTVTISLHQDVLLPYQEFFADVEPILLEAGGRPHWGKLHNLDANALRARHPRFDDFVALRERLDPERRFGNAHLEKILG